MDQLCKVFEGGGLASYLDTSLANTCKHLPKPRISEEGLVSQCSNHLRLKNLSGSRKMHTICRSNTVQRWHLAILSGY